MATGNSNEEVKSFGNVLMVDPNLVNINQNMVNSIPQYQDMFIFAELTAKSRGRSVIFTNNNSGLYSLSKESINKDIVVNFIGNNQDSAQPNSNYLNFTTNWYDGSTGDRLQTEGFGISNIKVVINSSYIPQVSIQFIDLRGLAFFNQENSPYRILFNFPPPIFYLTLKGYYGKPLKYMLHLVKYTSDFKAENGNFIIDAQFIAMTFAPLTDVLFRYVVNFPLIVDKVSMNPAPDIEPKDTFELILKLKSLYSQKGLPENADTVQYEQTRARIAAIDDLITLLDSCKNDAGLKIWKNSLSLYTGNYNVVTNMIGLTPINSTGSYNNTIQNSSDPGISANTADRIMIAYQLSKEDLSKSNPLLSVGSFYSTPASQMESTLKTYKQKIITAASSKNIIIPSTSAPVIKQISAVNANDNLSYTYMSLDITDYYQTIYREKIRLQNENTVLINQINTNINNMIHSKLGMQPTIYNIFKIILNDVDKFFNILRRISYDAENRHHPEYKSIILSGDYRDVKNNAKNADTHIFAFPLFIWQQKICNQIRETRVAPIELSDKIVGDPFPEIKLVHDFIDSFTLQRNLSAVYDMRSAQNADGTYLWIPISPFDSVLGTDENATPYLGVDTSGGGALSQPIPLSPDSKIVTAIKIILKRFYILSQNSIPYKFYTDKNYVDFFAKSEPINLVASIFNSDYTNLLFEFAKSCKDNPSVFYNFVQDNIPELYNFPESQHLFFSVTDGADIVELRTIDNPYLKGDAYVNKKNENFHGFNWQPIPVNAQVPASTTTTTPATNNPVQDFINNVHQSDFSKFWKGVKLNGILQFTNENVFYINDIDPSTPTTTLNINTKTRFLTDESILNIYTTNNNLNDTSTYQMLYINSGVGKISLAYEGAYQPGLPQGSKGYNRIDFINVINNNSGDWAGTPYGNAAFNKIGAPILFNAEQYGAFTDIVNIWANQLGEHDEEIYDTIIDINNVKGKYNSRLAALILASSFGYALSPFNIYPNNLNIQLFDIPAAIQTPLFILYYMGALIDISPTDPFYKIIYDFFVSGAGKKLNSCGALIFADIIDINKQLALADKDMIADQYKPYYNPVNNGQLFYSISANLLTLYNTVQADSSVIGKTGSTRVNAKKILYGQLLNPATTTGNNNFFASILQQLISKQDIINFSEITFKRDAIIQVGYDCLNTTNANGTKVAANNDYFKGFFSNLYQEIKDKQEELKKQKEEDDKLGADRDIVTQTYYSFKNINDKWLSTPSKNNLDMGYPFNEDSPNLIDMFAFVDRAMNPIGDTIINPQHLIELLDDENATVFSVLSELLAMNDFEFFPLQNFMKFENDDWKESFKIDTVGDVTAKPAFVCMYFGGSSSYPTGINSFGGQYNDDCIVDLTNPKDGGGKDFNIQTEGCIQNTSNDAQVQRNPFFPYGKVRAYRVRFAEQNQSMFTNIKIDSKEYPETNESIKILSRLSGDNKLQAPSPKGQNLYNLYENRSYKATVLGFGNMMLQPTQYFQIENVPLFNGAYITLSVEHNIEPNKMTTSVSGTKILKYPVPRVLEASSILGFEGGNSYDTNAGDSSAGTVTLGPNGMTINAPQAQYNSMYDFKVQ